PSSRREGRGARLHDRMDPLGHGAIPWLHRGDRREHVAFPVRVVLAGARGRLQLSAALLHRRPFLGRESLGRLAGGALGGLLRVFRWAHRNLFTLTWVAETSPQFERGSRGLPREPVRAG